MLHVPADANAALMLLSAARVGGDRPAVFDGDGVTTYDELVGRSRSIAATLASAGVEPGDRVCIMLRRSTDAAAAYFGAMLAGSIAVVVHEDLRSRQLEHVLNHSGARVLIAPAMTPPASGITVLDPGSVRQTDGFEPVARTGQDVAQIIYTSGSTGLPKGVTLSHANVWAAMSTVVTYLGITADDRLASLLPFSFDYGLNQLLCAVGTGASLVIERSPVPHRLVAGLRRRDVTVLAAVPPLWLQLLAVESFRESPLPSLRIMTNTGGRIPTAAVRQLRACQPQSDLVLMYGLTEAFRSTYLPPDEVEIRPDSIGRAIPGAEILVLREDLTPCEPGEVGQLVHRGPTVAMGYWSDPDATAQTYRPHPLRPAGTPERERVVYSGDLVYRDESGALFFVSRADKMIKTLGYRVGPDEVVDVLFASGEVTEAVVVGEPDEVRGEGIIAYVVLSPRGSRDRLEEFCAREMPHYMRPARIEVRTELPRTSSGKHDVRATTTGGHAHG
jgi:acyl-CoA synthetase (AMP-forming)/AMP-acid ligase II